MIRSTSRSDIAAAIVTAGRRLHERRILASREGNLSARVDADRILTTATGTHKGRLREADLVLVDLAGTPLSDGEPSSELKMHLAIYEERPEVRAVVHAHPPIATGYAVAGKQPPAALAEVVGLLGCVPVAPYGTPSTTALADSVRAPIRDFDVVLLANHGAVAAGSSLEEAEERMVQLEHFAQIALVAHLLGGPRHFSREQIAALSELREAAGGPPVPAICYPSTDESGTITLSRQELVDLIADALRAIR
jgi:L-fuculose-phosphate aldolase